MIIASFTTLRGLKQGEYMRTIRVYLQDFLLVDSTQPESGGRFLRWFFCCHKGRKGGSKWLTNQI
jgi:hypothetical protein